MKYHHAPCSPGWVKPWFPAFAVVFSLTATFAMSAPVYSADPSGRLPEIGPAPPFTLINQDGRRFSARDMRGRVAVVTFIFTTCSAACPVLTAKLVAVQRRLAAAKNEVIFAAVTVDPMNDTPAVLRKYAQSHSADLKYFAFLSGPPAEIENLARRYKVYSRQAANSSIDHTFLTSIVDRQGTIRMQYLGTRFDPGEFLADVRSLLAEGTPQ